MPGVPRPMLATAGELPLGPGWSFELKWDGVRALAVVRQGHTRLYARSGSEITEGYPEFAGLGAALARLGITNTVVDGEIVVLDAKGHPSFMALAERIHVRDLRRARQLAAATPACFMIFDVLRVNGADVTSLPYVDRREWLDSIGDELAAAGPWVVPPRFSDGPATVVASKEMELEGVVAKRLSSPYRPGTRSPDWIKIKHDVTGDYVVGGWRAGRRALGALLVGEPGPGGLRYRGRVGGGISAAVERDLLNRLAPLQQTTSPFADPLPRDDAKGARYTRPALVVEVRYGNVTPDGRLRFPRFVRLRPDKTPEDTDG